MLVRPKGGKSLWAESQIDFSPFLTIPIVSATSDFASKACSLVILDQKSTSCLSDDRYPASQASRLVSRCDVHGGVLCLDLTVDVYPSA
ncbi:unnamed protein product [Protopolystoma xenopodis]|uniref:Uncharacterized protein n=1 Tax=Protopolystoma xenopodis TaxID=117903 RepID=A0A448X810_9PLAT|nr:unnamed protein product [Protopolystoma xenopodis]